MEPTKRPATTTTEEKEEEKKQRWHLIKANT